jgi:hypothetical protein
MNKKLKLIGYVFNKYPMSESDEKIDKNDVMYYILDGLMNGVDEILDAQKADYPKNYGMFTAGYSHSATVTISGATFISGQNAFLSVGDTVSGQTTLHPKQLTLGSSTLTEEDLIKIKNSPIFTEDEDSHNKQIHFPFFKQRRRKNNKKEIH